MKKNKSEIFDLPLSFYLTRKYTVFCFKRFYNEFIVVGRENIPTDVSIIFAPNHINALMDAIAVHSVVSDKLSLIFLARADIFKNKTAANFLRFTKIVPAFRMRDGIENLFKNDEIFDQCVNILQHNAALGIMPEGNQGEQRKLRPIVKGIFRIAFSAQQQYGLNPCVKIVPIGIDLGDYVKFGKHIIISIGKPIEISDYMSMFADNPVNATNEIRNRLRDDLNGLSLNLASEKYYECFEIAVEVVNESMVEDLHLPDNTVYRFVARQKIAKRLIEIEKNYPSKIEDLNSLCTEYQANLNQFKLKDWLFERKNSKENLILSDLLLLFWTFPFYIYGFILNILPFYTPVFIRKNILKAKDIGFFSSLHFGLALLTFPLFYTLQTLLFSFFVSSTWWAVILFLVCQYPFGKWAFYWHKKFVKLRAKLHFARLNKNQISEIEDLVHLRNQIIDIVLNRL
jgi:1-acyl-sn-glycerol-3-phosphate acyltransferase